jgi:AcrR family transcriptional regulator
LEQVKSYHHGALREALLTAAETILCRDGLSALTLRAIAREAGVSHGAPAHHFKDLAELLSELAAVGYERLAGMLRGPEEDRRSRRFSTARAYVAFAIDNTALFQLMFRLERLNIENPRFRAARAETFAVLAEVSNGSTVEPSRPQLGTMTAQWCLVHGFAILAADGRLAPLLRIAPEGTQVSDLLDLALVHLAK